MYLFKVYKVFGGKDGKEFVGEAYIQTTVYYSNDPTKPNRIEVKHVLIRGSSGYDGWLD